MGERQLFHDTKTENLLQEEVRHFLNQSKIEIMLFTSPNEYGNLYKSEWFEGIYKVGILYDLIPLIFPEQCLFNEVYAQEYNKSIEFIK